MPYQRKEFKAIEAIETAKRGGGDLKEMFTHHATLSNI
jgi:hypothetical protein